MPQPLAVTAFMASPGRFELPAPRLGGVCSIQLSYGDIFDFSWSRMERPASQDFDDLIIRRGMLYPIELLAHMDNCPDIVTQIRAAVNAASRQKVPSPSATRPFSFLQRVPRSSGRRGLGRRLVGDLHVLLLRPPEGYPGRSPGQPPTGGVHLIEPLRRGHAADQQQRQQTTGDELFPSVVPVFSHDKPAFLRLASIFDCKYSTPQSHCGYMLLIDINFLFLFNICNILCFALFLTIKRKKLPFSPGQDII